MLSGSQKVTSPTEDKRFSLHSQSTNTSSTISQRSTRSHNDHKSSPASTTMRPRSGKEYQKLDRRKLAEIGLLSDSPSPKEKTPKDTPNSPKVFTFDVPDQLQVTSANSSIHSSATNSPRSPAVTRLQLVENPYVNITLPVDRADVSASLNDTPPASPYSAISNTSDSSSPLLHYAEIDMTHSTSKRRSKPTSTRSRRANKTDTEYAMIDIVATNAASRVGKEHAQNRENTLRRRDEKSAAREEASKENGKSPGHRKASAPASCSKRSSSTSLVPKDRKHSAS